jgi:hypothetical protein
LRKSLALVLLYEIPNNDSSLVDFVNFLDILFGEREEPLERNNGVFGQYEGVPLMVRDGLLLLFILL